MDASSNPHSRPPSRQLSLNRGQSAAFEDIKNTPKHTLNRFATIPRPITPRRRPSSVGPPSTHRSTQRTPTGQERTPGAIRGGSARRTITVTPHGRAAQRELDLRRAGLTPGKDRRRSGRQQRETPRDILRLLSRRLAPKSQPVVPTPERPNGSTIKRIVPDEEDDMDDTVPERPRLSLPFSEEDEEEDDSLLLPPQSTGLEDDNFTLQSVELGRRAVSERPPGRYSRGSFGSIRMSDVFADLNDQSGAFDSSYLTGDAFGNIQDAMDSPGDGLQEENTGTLGRISLTPGRNNDIRPDTIGGDDTETTFVLTVPPRAESEDPRDTPENHRLSDVSRISEVPDMQSDGEADPQEDEEIADLDSEPEDVNDMSLGAVDEGQASNSADGKLGDASLLDITLRDADLSIEKSKQGKNKKIKISKHGIQYPSLPAGVVKKLATTFARTSGNSKAKLNKETLHAIMQASDWFFEQVSDDLGAYAQHAGRKTIDESDIVTLMARQRQINATTTPFSLAQRYLPRELLQDLRMVPPSKLKRGRQLDRVEEDDAEDG